MSSSGFCSLRRPYNIRAGPYNIRTLPYCPPPPQYLPYNPLASTDMLAGQRTKQRTVYFMHACSIICDLHVYANVHALLQIYARHCESLDGETERRLVLLYGQQPTLEIWNSHYSSDQFLIRPPKPFSVLTYCVSYHDGITERLCYGGVDCRGTSLM